MLGLLQVPRIRIIDYETKYKIEVPEIEHLIPEGAYSFIVDRFSLPNKGYRVEAYPYINEFGNIEEVYIYVGMFEECLKAINNIAKVLKMRDIPHKTEMLNCSRLPKSIRYPYCFNERVRSKTDIH